MSEPRNSVRASALGSYFGVGYNDPLVQLENDFGNEEITFFQAQEDAMEVSSMMEDAIIDLVEVRNHCKIDERNTETFTAMDGKLRVRKDGMTTINGEPMVVEIKHVASGDNFVTDQGHHFQVYAQIIAERERGVDVNRGILAGLYKGKYYQKFLELTPELEEDINIMINTVVAILQGQIPVEMFPINIVEKYTNVPDAVDDFDEADFKKLSQLSKLKAQIKTLTEREKTMVDYFKEKYESLKYNSNDGLSITVSNQSRKGSVDINAIVTDYPDLDPERYRSEGSSFKTVRIK